MPDVFTPEKRSAVMARIRSRDTKPEIAMRRMLHRLGYRFTVNSRNNRQLPGRPDLVLPKFHTVIFVHGCFWHGHDCKRGARAPRRNADYWSAKIARNMARDAEVAAALGALGWRSHVVWECALRDPAAVAAGLRAFLGPPGRAGAG